MVASIVCGDRGFCFLARRMPATGFLSRSRTPLLRTVDARFNIGVARRNRTRRRGAKPVRSCTSTLKGACRTSPFVLPQRTHSENGLHGDRPRSTKAELCDCVVNSPRTHACDLEILAILLAQVRRKFLIHYVYQPALARVAMRISHEQEIIMPSGRPLTSPAPPRAWHRDARTFHPASVSRPRPRCARRSASLPAPPYHDRALRDSLHTARSSRCTGRASPHYRRARDPCRAASR